MGALVAFEAHGTWGCTLVCDHLVRESLQALGVGWGRQAAEAAQPFDAEQLATRHRTGGTEAPEHTLIQHAAGEGAVQQPGRSGQVVHWVQEGTLLVYLQARDGPVGVLCEAGEWVSIPPGVAYALDTGASAGLHARVLLQSQGASPGIPGLAVHGLPSHDAFVETLLEMTGYAGDG